MIILKILTGAGLFASFLMLFVWFAKERRLFRFLQRTYGSLEAVSMQRVHEGRRLLMLASEREGFWYRIEQRLRYSGLAVKFKFLTPELWLCGNLILCAAGYFGVLLFDGTVYTAVLAAVMIQLVRHLTESILMAANYRAVNDSMIKFLDFLGNYSITAGELTGIFHQISRYLEDPLKTVLEECYYEAQTSGDVSLALLTMAEKIEHPKFKELVKNMEISIRYSADFKSLVDQSRKSVRDHMRTRQERKSLVSEALVNVVILAGMSVAMILIVEQLVDGAMKEILLYSLPGRICLLVILVIFALLFGQVRRLDR